MTAPRSRPDIIEFITDPQLLGLTLSPAQETLLRGTYGLPLVTDEQLDLWRCATGRHSYVPGHPFGEVCALCGARGGKGSRIASPVVLYEAVYGDHERHLGRGERGIVPLVNQDLRATRINYGYVKDYVSRSPILRTMIEEVLASEIVLSNGISVVCFPCTLKSLRGWANPAAVMDEVAFWRLEGAADSDAEVQASIRRGTLNFPNPRLVKCSTPYMRAGVAYEDFKRGFGQDDPDLLVFRATSIQMNPTLTPARLDRERRLDPVRFAREFEAEFAQDLDTFLPSAWIDTAVVAGRHELPPQDGTRYYAAIDASGGGADAFTLAIIHAEGKESERRVVQDVMRGWRSSRRATVDLESIVAEIANILRAYHCQKVRGDRYAAAWVKQAFERHSMTLEDPGGDRSDAYLAIEPFFAQGRIEILDHPQLGRELRNLERRPRPGGKTVVDHPARGGHFDDHANSLALACLSLPSGRRQDWWSGVTFWGPESSPLRMDGPGNGW